MIISGKQYEVLEEEVEIGIRWADSCTDSVPWYKLLVDVDGDIFIAVERNGVDGFYWEILDPATCHIETWAN